MKTVVHKDLMSKSTVNVLQSHGWEGIAALLPIRSVVVPVPPSMQQSRVLRSKTGLAFKEKYFPALVKALKALGFTKLEEDVAEGYTMFQRQGTTLMIHEYGTQGAYLLTGE